MPSKLLVVGGDSLIGRGLVGYFRKQGVTVHHTSRRPNNGSADCIPLELGKAIEVPNTPDVAILCAGVTDFRTCAEQPDATWRINVDAVLELAAALHLRGSRILYLSSNAVCEIEHQDIQSSSLPTITTEYGAQKVAAERGILALGERATVVRATKIVSCKVPLFADWLTRLGNHVEIQPLSDKYFCPISLLFMVTWLTELASRNVSGVFHLSGACLVSYTEFALHLASSMSADDKLVIPTITHGSAIPHISYPQHSCLDMNVTTATVGATAQSVQSVIKDLLEEFSVEQVSARTEKVIG